MTEPAPRWQFNLPDLFVVCLLVAVFFAIFTALPLKFEHDDYRAIPAVIFTAWIGCLVRQLPKGKLGSRPRTIASLLVTPFLGVGAYFALRPWPLRDRWDLLTLIIGTSGFAAYGLMLSWMYERYATALECPERRGRARQ